MRTAETLLAGGIDARVLPNSLTALDALEASATSATLELLVTCPQFAAEPPHGVALALMARQKRPGSGCYSSALESWHLTRKD